MTASALSTGLQPPLPGDRPADPVGPLGPSPPPLRQKWQREPRLAARRPASDELAAAYIEWLFRKALIEAGRLRAARAPG